MLTHYEVARYLLRLGLVSQEQVVEGDLMVSGIPRRNANFKIVSKDRPGYLLKQGSDPERRETVENEAAVYRLLLTRSPRLGRYLPTLSHYSPGEHILVLGYIEDAVTLERHHRIHGRFSSRLAADLGAALAELHRSSWGGAGEEAEETRNLPIRRDPPWILSLHRPGLGMYCRISSANLQLIATIQKFPELGMRFEQLRQEWSHAVLVHFDVKWDNVLVAPKTPANAHGKWTYGIKLVDWELAGLGDPCWDVGTVFGEYLGFWLHSIPSTGENSPDYLLDLARYPLRKMQPAIREFWRSYSRRMRLDMASHSLWLMRAVRYAAARLVQTAFEQGQTMAQLSGNALSQLQLSLNMLQRPEQAAVHLLGIDLPAAGLPSR